MLEKREKMHAEPKNRDKRSHNKGIEEYSEHILKRNEQIPAEEPQLSWPSQSMQVDTPIEVVYSSLQNSEIDEDLPYGDKVEIEEPSNAIGYSALVSRPKVNLIEAGMLTKPKSVCHAWSQAGISLPERDGWFRDPRPADSTHLTDYLYRASLAFHEPKERCLEKREIGVQAFEVKPLSVHDGQNSCLGSGMGLHRFVIESGRVNMQVMQHVSAVASIALQTDPDTDTATESSIHFHPSPHSRSVLTAEESVASSRLLAMTENSSERLVKMDPQSHGILKDVLRTLPNITEVCSFYTIGLDDVSVITMPREMSSVSVQSEGGQTQQLRWDEEKSVSVDISFEQSQNAKAYVELTHPDLESLPRTIQQSLLHLFTNTLELPTPSSVLDSSALLSSTLDQSSSRLPYSAPYYNGLISNEYSSSSPSLLLWDISSDILHHSIYSMSHQNADLQLTAFRSPHFSQVRIFKIIILYSGFANLYIFHFLNIVSYLH
ncbi:unnamed protein product [Protopolystoma xenopodis]|uniref:Uncharacterized protein n=1 Tax=Protopolystoma xenopodis TaxID=117903 RepID=A0A448WM17_9PLAT|nr:unnamed protein product [Protopolystoma xenopodis]